ncbi:DUF4340 domain-containing protein [uncultured Thiohalocapsa sp.]|uniref:DUF4340 domain-containing protein n=1 Tax=uncultured Thiohalocapsa sp. TaxID=768990 RepID=UPI0025D1C6E7|nr:DUF4340 domain-containing protein [uncultured Thiohalocapsa sp.]
MSQPAAPRRFGLDTAWRSALLSPLVLLLAALLVVQLVMALLMGGGRSMAPAAGDLPLLDLDMDAVTAIEISTADGDSVRLARSGDDWVLPALDGFPASGSRIETLLDDLAGLERPLPVATSAEARRRFRVADDAFERRLTLRGDGGAATLLVGDSPGFRRLFARVGGEEAVYDLRLALFDLGASPDDWIDRGRLQFDRGEISRISADDWTLVRGEEGWSLEGSDATVDSAAADQLADAVATVGYISVLGPDSAADYDLDDPARVIAIEHAGGERRYRLAPIADSGDYALRRDGEPYVYRLSAFDAEILVDTDRARLLGETAADEDGDVDGSADEASSAADASAAQPPMEDAAAPAESEAQTTAPPTADVAPEATAAAMGSSATAAGGEPQGVEPGATPPMPESPASEQTTSDAD